MTDGNNYYRLVQLNIINLADTSYLHIHHFQIIIIRILSYSTSTHAKFVFVSATLLHCFQYQIFPDRPVLVL